jgi:DNA-binding NtrC family response regulator
LLARTAKRPVEQVADLLPPATLEVMMNYDWPGNVRELANAMEYSFIVSGGQPISPEHLPATVLQPRVQVAVGGGPATTATANPSPRLDPAQPLASPRTLKAVEMEHILRIYEKNNRDKKATAAELGVSLKTLYNKLNQYEEERRSLLGET